MRVKICGITKPDQGQAIAQMGATALGFICVPTSPRYILPEKIRAVVDGLPINIDRIGVFANSTPEKICQITADSSLTGVQLHGDESAEFCQQLRRSLPAGVEIIKALRVKTSTPPETLQIPSVMADAYARVVDAVLLDAYDPQRLGGTGKKLDWENLRHFLPSCPWFLAGGLTPENVLEAIAQVKPSGIDLSSGVERSPGEKDLAKVGRLFERLNA